MKKLVLAAAALFLLSLAACSDSAAPAQAAGDAQTGIVMLDAGVWPENDYTAGASRPARPRCVGDAGSRARKLQHQPHRSHRE